MLNMNAMWQLTEGQLAMRLWVYMYVFVAFISATIQQASYACVQSVDNDPYKYVDRFCLASGDWPLGHEGYIKTKML